jgi:hypothetical protein
VILTEVILRLLVQTVLQVRSLSNVGNVPLFSKAIGGENYAFPWLLTSKGILSQIHCDNSEAAHRNDNKTNIM